MSSKKKFPGSIFWWFSEFSFMQLKLKCGINQSVHHDNLYSLFVSFVLLVAKVVFELKMMILYFSEKIYFNVCIQNAIYFMTHNLSYSSKF